jgi:hypothetical protein
VLNKAFRSAFSDLVRQDSPSFIRGWLEKSSLPGMLFHRDAEDGLETVIRELLWSYSERNNEAVARMVNAFPDHNIQDQDESKRFEARLTQLADDYPAIAWSLARSGRHKHKMVIRSVAEGLAFQSNTTDFQPGIGRAVNDSARLIGFEPQQLNAAIVAFAARLEGAGVMTDTQVFQIRRLGETVSGRRTLAAALLLRLAETRVL